MQQHEHLGAFLDDVTVVETELTATRQQRQAVREPRCDLVVDEAVELPLADPAAGPGKAEEELGADERVTSQLSSARRFGHGIAVSVGGGDPDRDGEGGRGQSAEREP